MNVMNMFSQIEFYFINVLFSQVIFVTRCCVSTCTHIHSFIKNSFASSSYRYTLDDLYPMMNAVKQRAELYDEWASRVTETLEAKLEKKKGKQERAKKTRR